MTRVATYSSNSALIGQLMDIQKRLTDGQIQVSTGKKSLQYSGISQDAHSAITFENERNRIQSFKDNNQLLDVRLQTMATSSEALHDVVSEFQKALVSFSSIDLNTPMTPEKQQEVDKIQRVAFESMKQLEDLLNTRIDGQYIYAGGKIDNPPVQLKDKLTNAAFGTVAQFQATYNGVAQTFPTTRASNLDPASAPAYHQPYYVGDQMQSNQRISDGRTLTMGINGSDGAFEKAFRAMGIIAQGALGTNSGRVQQALDLVNDSLNHSPSTLPNESTSDLQSIETKIAEARQSINSANKRTDQMTLYLDNRISDMENVDKAEAITKMNSDMLALQASYTSLSKIQTVSLVNYMR